MNWDNKGLSETYIKLLKRAIIDEKIIYSHLCKYNDIYCLDRALDMACGSGYLSVMIKRKFKIKNVHGIDIDSDIIMHARNTVDEKIYFQEGDARKLPYRDNYFNLVFSRMLFEVCPDVETILDEAIRVTKNGGRIFFWGNLNSTPLIYPLPKHYNKYLSSENKILRATKKYSYNPLELYYLFCEKGLQQIELVPIVKDINNFTRNELVDYYYEKHNSDTNLLTKFKFLSKDELCDYESDLLKIMTSDKSYYCFLQYYITAVVKK